MKCKWQWSVDNHRCVPCLGIEEKTHSIITCERNASDNRRGLCREHYDLVEAYNKDISERK